MRGPRPTGSTPAPWPGCSRTGELDGVWMPDRETQVMRRRVGRRTRLVRSRARAKNEIHATLMRCLVGRAPFREPFGPKGRRWLAELELPAEERESVDAALPPDRLPGHRDRGGRAPDRGRGARVCGDQAADDRPRRQRDRRRHVHGPGRRDRPAVTARASWSATSGSTRAWPSRARPRDPRTDLKAGIGLGPPRPGRVQLVGGPPAGPAARLLWARPRPPRPQRGDRRGRAQARLPVLVPAQPPRGLRLPAALADRQEAAAARAPRRRAVAQGPLHRDVRDPPEDADGRTRARSAGRVPYKRMVTEWQRTQVKRNKGAGATPGRASKGPSSGQATRQVQAPGLAL